MTDYHLLDAYLRLQHAGPEWGEAQLTNHGPMVAETLARRGHGDRLPGWIDGYVPRLDDLPRPGFAVDDRNWRSALGDGRRVADWTLYFGRQLAAGPWRSVLARWWPRLLPGVAAGTTHGVIRVGHVVRTLLAGGGAGPPSAELAAALGFWAARYQPIPGSVPPSGALSPADALAGLPSAGAGEGGVAQRLARLPGTPGYTSGLAALRAPIAPSDASGLLADLVAAGVRQYLRHGAAGPVLLVHAATAPNAIFHTLPALPPELWIRSFRAAWSATAAISAAYRLPAPPAAGAGAPAPPSVADISAPPTVADASAPPAAADGFTAAGTPPEAGAADLFALAAEHGDEHVIKFTDTALEVLDRTGDPAAPAAAALAARLIEPPG
jgi:hypothetical protein